MEKKNYFFYHRIFFLLIFIMSTEMVFLPTFFSDLFHTLWFGKRILCGYKMKFKNTREILFVVTHVMTAVTFTLQRVGLMKKQKNNKIVIYFQNWVYQMLQFFLRVSITLFPFLSIYLTYLFLTCVIMCLYTIGKYWNWISKHEWIWIPILFYIWLHLYLKVSQTYK